MLMVSGGGWISLSRGANNMAGKMSALVQISLSFSQHGPPDGVQLHQRVVWQALRAEHAMVLLARLVAALRRTVDFLLRVYVTCERANKRWPSIVRGSNAHRRPGR